MDWWSSTKKSTNQPINQFIWNNSRYLFCSLSWSSSPCISQVHNAMPARTELCRHVAGIILARRVIYSNFLCFCGWKGAWDAVTTRGARPCWRRRRWQQPGWQQWPGTTAACMHLIWQQWSVVTQLIPARTCCEVQWMSEAFVWRQKNTNSTLAKSPLAIPFRMTAVPGMWITQLLTMLLLLLWWNEWLQSTFQ